MMHMTKSNIVTTVKVWHNFPWFHWSHALFSPTTDRSKVIPNVSREWWPSQSEECRNSTLLHHIQILWLLHRCSHFLLLDQPSATVDLAEVHSPLPTHPYFLKKKSSPFPSCPQVQQCSQHWIFPVTDLNHLFLLTVLSSNFVFFLTVPALMLELYRCEHSGKNKFYTQTLKYLQATHFQPSSHPSANNMCKYTVPNSRCCGHIRGKCSIASWCTQWVATTWIANSLKELFN